ncbi:MAG: signal peptide peptidase SppA, partial [Anaerolineales bacterium]
ISQVMIIVLRGKMHNMNEQESKKSRQSGGRSALWALLGLIVGFSLPVLICMGIFFVFVLGLSAIGSGGGAAGPGIPVHVSGPLTGPAIAVIEVNGPITSGRAPAFNSIPIAASEDLTRIIRFTTKDPDVKAILLKVNSPGGSVVASDQIYQELKNAHLPIVVLMGEMSASGGYYISVAGDYLIANPNTLAGSIGVISTIPNAEELFEKVGVEFNVFTSGDAKDFGSLYRNMTPEETGYWQGVIDETHDGFVAIVAEGRNMSEDEVRALADGRVYTGRQALELGLVDALGYERDAINKAAKLGIIGGEPRVIRYTSDTGFFSLLDGLVNVPQNGVPYKWIEWMLTPRLEFRWVP